MIRQCRDLLDEPPPAAVAQERALLGAMLVDPGRVEAATRAVCAEEFYDDANRALFEAIQTLAEAGQPVGDINTLIPGLRRLGVSETLWPVFQIGRLIGEGIAGHEAYYALEIRDKATLRRQLDLAANLMRRVHAEGDPLAISRWLDGQLANLGQPRATTAQRVGAVVADVLEDIDEAGQGPRRGLMTGLHSLDQAIGSMMPGELIIAAGRPGNGKTSFGMQVALHNALRDRPALFCSLEMTAKELTQRLLCSLGGVDERRVRNGAVSRDERADLIEAGRELHQLPLHIWAPPRASVSDIRGVARLQQKSDGLALLVVDYIGLVQASDPRRPRYEQVSAISAALKQLGKELQVPLLALCQLNREAEKGRPQLSHLRESGSIEQDADVVLFLHFPSGDQQAELIVAKHRHGERGVLRLEFIRSETRFV